MLTENFDFTAPDGRAVAARLDRPAGQTRAHALFAHCFACGKDALASARISRALAAEGIATLRIDFAGVEALRSRAAPEGFGADVADLVAAAARMRDGGIAPRLLVGHSLGGAAAIAAAGQIPEVAAVATIAAPFDVEHVMKLLGPGPEAHVGGRLVQIKPAFVEGLRGHDQAARLKELGRALLVLHSPVDEVVSLDEAAEIFVAAKHPKSFVSLDRADHMLSAEVDIAYAAAVIAAWASRYVEAPKSPEEPPADGVVRAHETGAGKFQVRVHAGGAVLNADEPVSVGGLASGPTPYELVGAGLAACTAMTLRLYADHKGWPLARASVEVRHEKRKGETPADLFERSVCIDGELDGTQRERLLEIADRCPVHRTLEGGAAIRTVEGAPRAPAPGEEEHFAEMERACED
ncbi:OsmC family protein [Brevundimonas sp.]|uniref:bifunctional alpha/beta hydrolase/OsmC family protein n=1 Tax=Brevundimonas sp. TaxID=1871086 RepID=UPI0035B1A050